MTPRSSVQSTALALAMLSLAGCGSINSSFGSLLEPDRIDYKSASKTTQPRLEVPPDLTALQRDNRYQLPEVNRGVATASGFNAANKEAAAITAPTAGVPVAPKPASDMRIEREGNQRWLVVKQSPEVLWPQIKDFWTDNGFLINIDNPGAGIMETDWAENRAKIPDGILRNTLGKVLDSLYSTGERDKFRTRLERNADGSTEIFISHRGAKEVIAGAQKDNILWTPRPADPELEAEFVAKLMTRLGSDGTKAKQAVALAAATPELQHAKLVKASAGNYVEVDEGFERAWRRVGLALDRVGFTVEDRDRTQGLYFVRYVDQDADAKKKTEAGFFSKIFTGKDDKAKLAAQYRIAVKGAGANSQVQVQNAEGRIDVSPTSDRILALLNEQLK
ncbi:MAG: outer membrane protein assembly factor BamC [Janthinobacterium lividum]